MIFMYSEVDWEGTQALEDLGVCPASELGSVEAWGLEAASEIGGTAHEPPFCSAPSHQASFFRRIAIRDVRATCIDDCTALSRTAKRHLNDLVE